MSSLNEKVKKQKEWEYRMQEIANEMFEICKDNHLSLFEIETIKENLWKLAKNRIRA